MKYICGIWLTNWRFTDRWCWVRSNFLLKNELGKTPVSETHSSVINNDGKKKLHNCLFKSYLYQNACLKNWSRRFVISTKREILDRNNRERTYFVWNYFPTPSHSHDTLKSSITSLVYGCKIFHQLILDIISYIMARRLKIIHYLVVLLLTDDG